MRKMIKKRALLIGCFLIPALPATTAELRVIVSGVKTSLEGAVMADLYNAEEGFLEKGFQIEGILIPVTAETISNSFVDLPAGKYVVALFHDEDNDGKMDTSLFGIPEEGYGFSGPKKASTRPPSFAEGPILLSANRNETKKTEITLKCF